MASAFTYLITLLMTFPAQANLLGLQEREMSKLVPYSLDNAIALARSKVMKTMGKLPNMHVTEYVHINGHTIHIKAAAVQNPDLELARLSVNILKDRVTAKITYLEVFDPKNFRKGLSELMFGEMLKAAPGVRRIQTNLAEDNLDELNRALKRGAPCILAFKETPAYRMRAQFGFTKIAKPVCQAPVVSFEVSRPD